MRPGSWPWEPYTPDVTFVTRGELDGRQTLRGHDGLRRGLALFRSVWGQGMRFSLLEVVGEGETLVVVVRIRLRGTSSGVEVEVEESWATWFRAGLIARLEQYGTRAEAIQAAGLSD